MDLVREGGGEIGWKRNGGEENGRVEVNEIVQMAMCQCEGG